MKIFKILGGILFVLFAVYLILCFVGPKNLEVERTLTVEANQKSAYIQVVNLKNWENWSPWAEMDPDMEVSYGEIVEGEGASYSWNGEINGKGSLTIVKANAFESLTTALDFGEMGKGTGYWEFEKVDENATAITWGMKSDEIPFPFRAMMLFQNMDDTFDKGIKAVGEEAAKNPFVEENKNLNFEITTLPPSNYVGFRKNITFEEMSSFFTESFTKIVQLSNNQFSEKDIPAGVYFEWDEENGTTDVAAVYPVKELTSFKKNGFGYYFSHDESKAILYDYFGNNEGSYAAHMEINSFIDNSEDIQFKGPVIEQYFTDPNVEMDTSKWHTRIIYLVE